MHEQAIPLGLCQCGCGERTTIATRTSKRDDQVRGRPNRYVNWHHAVARTMTLYVEDDRGCWIWQRPLNRKGYGSLYCPRNGTCRAAHRVIYEREHGFPIPDGKHLHHLCGVPACVNPEHLEVVSPGEHGGGREVRAIRTLVAGGVEVALVARAFQTTEDRVRRMTQPKEAHR